MESNPASRPSGKGNGVFAFFALADAITWVLAAPAALVWMHRRVPPPYAVACAGLSAFGPLLAALSVAAPRRELGRVFGRWRTHPGWVLLALAAPITLHTAATALFVAIGGHPTQWFYPPSTPESLAALVVFPLGEEFGWRGFAHPRMVERFGLVRGPLLVGAAWGLWHLMYAITPAAAGFDSFQLGMILVELPLYALLIAWVFERANRSMAVALAFHAGAHLDHIERAPRTDLRLQMMHVLVLAVVAAFAARSLARQRGHRSGGAP